MIYIKKSLQLSEDFVKKNRKKVEKIIKDLNNMLNDKVCFSINRNSILNILVYEENLKNLKSKSKTGRPIEHYFDFEKVQQMKADGMTNKQIYTELGMSKALFYLRMKEYKK